MAAEDLQAELTAAGIDYATGLARFMGNQAIYRQLLGKFIHEDHSYADFLQALAAQQMKQAEESVHTLKGTAGNLSLMELFRRADAVVKAIRKHEDMADIQSLSQQVTASYEQTCAVLEKMLAE